MRTGSNRYSPYIRPFLYLIDLSIIVVVAQSFFFDHEVYYYFGLYSIFTWIIISHQNSFYEVYRFTPLLKILYLLIRQFISFAVLIFAFFGFFNEVEREVLDIFRYILISLTAIAVFKIGVFSLLKKYRTIIERNFRKVIILGNNSKTRRLKDFFNYNPVYGYQLIQTFDFKRLDFNIDDIINLIEKENIDEIYCSISELDNKQLAEIVKYADNNLKIVKFLADNREIFARKMNYQYYGITPILSLRELPIEKSLNQFLKRALDIVIAIVIIVGIMSWITPLLAIFIRIESKGPIFYKQLRNGLDNQVFYCYKFRSMVPNNDKIARQVIKNDRRVTKVGKFLRKTSLDELPQFFNVLIGNMSVVGPRPHPISQTQFYASRIDKFMVRHFVKPGITGLAQVSGYRGEIENEKDIVNRVRFDIFYLENWSILMDLRIMAKTIVNTLKGDTKAY